MWEVCAGEVCAGEVCAGEVCVDEVCVGWCACGGVVGEVCGGYEMVCMRNIDAYTIPYLQRSSPVYPVAQCQPLIHPAGASVLHSQQQPWHETHAGHSEGGKERGVREKRGK